MSSTLSTEPKKSVTGICMVEWKTVPGVAQGGGGGKGKGRHLKTSCRLSGQRLRERRREHRPSIILGRLCISSSIPLKARKSQLPSADTTGVVPPLAAIKYLTVTCDGFFRPWPLSSFSKIAAQPEILTADWARDGTRPPERERTRAVTTDKNNNARTFARTLIASSLHV